MVCLVGRLTEDSKPNTLTTKCHLTIGFILFLWNSSVYFSFFCFYTTKLVKAFQWDV